MNPAASTGPPQAYITCTGCSTYLQFPQGAQNVRCASCGQISSVTAAAGADMAQLVCSSPACRIVLTYPRGANQVQCSVCNTINCALAANQVGHVVCNQCQITLMYAYGAQSVKCAVCDAVTPVDATSGRGSSPHSTPPATLSVVVENPPDEYGNPSIAIGVTTLK